ncbi:MAG: GlmU family protein [Spirochaetota bacterium]
MEEGGDMEEVVIFEDAGYRNLLPLVYTRAAFQLRCGMSTLLEKAACLYPHKKISLICRSYLEECIEEELSYPVNDSGLWADEACRKQEGGAVLFINGRAVLSQAVPVEGTPEVGRCDEEVVYARINREKLKGISPSLFLEGNLLEELKKYGIPSRECQAAIITYPWELAVRNGDQIVEDFKNEVKTSCIEGRVYPGVYLLNESQIYIGKGSKIKPGGVLDAEQGPIYIGEDVTVLPNSFIQGPAFIGNGSRIKTGAKIYEGTTIGEVCKVGGEVEESIIHSYSNKQHDGFLGHSYLGMWCNLGAGTSNSDLKNNYGNVKVPLGGGVVDSGRMFVGLTMGDHSKTGINTMFNTGTVVGVMCNIFGEGFPPKFIPSFGWGGKSGLHTHELEKAIQTAGKVMQRRKKELTPAQQRLLKKIFEITAEERERAGINGYSL